MDQLPTADHSSPSSSQLPTAAHSSPSSSQSNSSTLPSIESPVIAKSLNYNLPIKLNRDNYVHWKALVLPAIRALELKDFINGVRLCPNKFVANIDPNSSEKDMVISSDFLAWRRLDQLLLVWLLSTVSESLIGHVTECSSALEAWRTLEDSFAQQSLAKTMQLRQQLGSAKKGSSTVADFVMKVKSIGDNLRAAGDKVSDRDLILSVVNGVGHEFDAVGVHITSQKNAISLHEAQYLLMLHEQRIEHLNTAAQVDVSPSANFVSNNNNTNGGRGGNNRGSGNSGGRNGGNRGRRGRGN